eukprot:contig_11415_g2718
MPVDAGHNTKLRDIFKSVNAFKNAQRDDVNAALVDAGWGKCTINPTGDTLTGFFQPVLDVIMQMVSEGKSYELYPVRIRLINVVTDAVYFVTVAFIPVARKLNEPGAVEKARLRRNAMLQRVLYLAYRTAIGATHSRVSVVVGGRSLLVFPRLLLFLTDILEEKAMLCLKSGKCAHPCSSCGVRVNHTGTSDALTNERNAIRMLTTHLEVAGHRQQHQGTRRGADLEARTSAQSAVPALAGFAGLSTAPFLVDKLIGFDVLHVLDLGVTGMPVIAS